MGGIKAVAGRKPKLKADSSSEFADVTTIDPPEYFNSMFHADRMWQCVVPELIKRKTLRVTDIHNVEMFCIAYENLRKSQQVVATMGITLTTDQGSVIKNPALTALNEASKQIAQFGSMLGLDPVSRGRLIGTDGSKKSNAFAEVLGM